MAVPLCLPGGSQSGSHADSCCCELSACTLPGAANHPAHCPCGAVHGVEQGRRTLVLGTALPVRAQVQGSFESTAVFPPWAAGSRDSGLLRAV